MTTKKSMINFNETVNEKNGGRLKNVMDHNELEMYDFKKEMKPYYEQYKASNPVIINQVLQTVPYLDESLSSMEQFFKYRTADAEIAKKFYSGYDTSIKPFDCDSSQLAEEIYRLLWNYEKEKDDWYGKIHLNDAVCKVGPDTMNSFKTVFNLVIDRGLLDKENERFDVFTMMMNKFAKATHTLGNFVLVPAGFNKFRYAPTKDFMDASLVVLKKEGYSNPTIESSFDKELFPLYVNKMFLFDYVHKSNNEYRINSMFDEMLNLEQDKASWLERFNSKDFALYMLQYIGSVCTFIYRRSLLMGLLLNFKLSDDPIKKEIAAEVDQFLNSYEYLHTIHDDGYAVIFNKLEEIIIKKELLESDIHREFDQYYSHFVND